MLMVTRTKAVLPVLIDTWWNVNQYFSKPNFYCINSFNRYMVECELFTKK